MPEAQSRVGVYFHRLSRKEAATKASWPTTPATIGSSGVTRQRTPGENGGEFDRYSIHYSYEVGGETFRGMFYSDKPKNFPALQAKYAPAGTFPVYYNPAKPSHSEVRDQLGRMGGVSWGWAAFLLYIFGVLVMFLGWTMFR